MTDLHALTEDPAFRELLDRLAALAGGDENDEVMCSLSVRAGVFSASIQGTEYTVTLMIEPREHAAEGEA